jgi:hypothetical protein
MDHFYIYGVFRLYGLTEVIKQLKKNTSHTTVLALIQYLTNTEL